MNNFVLESAYFGVTITLGTFFIGRAIKNKLKSEIFNPILISIVLIIAFLLAFGIDYDTYYKGAQYISYLLTPATICLAIPLYEQFEVLKKNAVAVIVGITSSVIASVGSVSLLGYLMKLSRYEWATLAPKSVTSAIGMSLAEELGGNPSLAASVIIITGIVGNMIARGFLKALKVTDPVAVGVAIGSSSHGIGTTKAREIGEVEGAVSSLSIVVAGIITVILLSFFA